MNANKLFKLLKRGEDSYNRLNEYKKILDQTERVTVDFTDFKSFDVFTDQSMTQAKTTGLSSPFDNVLLDINGIEVSNIADGSISKSNLLLHVIPIEVTTDISTFNIMLIQDMRVMDNDVYPRSHIVSLEEDVLSMPVVDDGMAALGCACYKKNPLSYGLIFKQIQSFTPGFKADIGFALRNCVSNIPMCKKLLDESMALTRITAAAMTYITMPPHKPVMVTESSNSKSRPYYMICDDNSWKSLQETGQTSKLAFNDGNDFASFTKPATFTGTITRGKLTYQVFEKS